MTRRYQLKQRAEAQGETRRRIVAAAVELHETQGPARTTITEIAERAGVGRLTVYRHFPDETALLTACSTAYMQAHPFPDTAAWRRIANPTERFRTALREAYDYHDATEPMMSRVLPDVGDHPIMAPYHDAWRQAAEVVTSAWDLHGRERALLEAATAHALSFPTWQSLVRRHGLTRDEAVEVMTRLGGDA